MMTVNLITFVLIMNADIKDFFRLIYIQY